MKKAIFIFAASLLALTACTKTDVVSVQRDEIRFRTLMGGRTKAMDPANITTANIDWFNVSATHGENYYMNSVEVNKSGTDEWTYSDTRYWPIDDVKINFYAYSPKNDNLVRNVSDPEVIADCRTFTVTSAPKADDQIDFVFAATLGCDKAANKESGVTLNFRHAMSKMDIKILNTNSDLQYVISGWKIAGMDNVGTFTFTKSTDNNQYTGENLKEGTLDSGYYLRLKDWSNNTTWTSANESLDDLDAVFEVNNGTEGVEILDPVAITGTKNMILIPQAKVPMALKYGTDSKLDGAYIAVKMSIKSRFTGEYLAGDAENDIWCCWPIDFEWYPGCKYTYVLDLSSGGYYENGTPGEDRKPILADNRINFADVTFADWDDSSEPLSGPAE